MMLTKASEIQGYAVAASDGQIGTVSDFLFDDASWRIRWLVVDTGTWLSSRSVLLPASTLGHLNPTDRLIGVKATMQQVKESPALDTERSVSRQMEANLYGHYGWAPYWGNSIDMGGYYGYMGGGFMPLAMPAASDRRDTDDPHLRSSGAVTGYHIHAEDGEIGHVEDFLVEEADWSIHYLIVDTKNWWPGKRVLISPRSVREIDWSQSLVTLDVDRQRVQDSPAYDKSMSVDRAYEKNLHGYYTDRPDDRPSEAI